ncbi:hypothetical protein KSF_012920 [Reticulibacter mediterranei]|uniref:Uncharacterized protein n=1 Tax=Reticulibacter mediterranei TaxID=2778369 RepID=A0A8J3I9A2_9CHLR|nr:hypothetical protein KSF_012920 [Reticulibacter mediterranei]
MHECTVLYRIGIRHLPEYCAFVFTTDTFLSYKKKGEKPFRNRSIPQQRLHTFIHVKSAFYFLMRMHADEVP